MWNRKKWTPDEDAFLKDLHKKGNSRLAISILLGRSMASVKSRLERIGAGAYHRGPVPVTVKMSDSSMTVTDGRKQVPFGKTDLYAMWLSAMANQNTQQVDLRESAD